MAEIKLKGNLIHTSGELPKVGVKIPDFRLTRPDLSDVTLQDFAGRKLILNIFPSIDTGICAMSVRKFNADAASLPNTVVVCVSKDTPFALKRFCGAEGIENVVVTSSLRDDSFGTAYGLKITEGGMAGLLSRCVIVTDENGIVKYSEQVPEIVKEPDYEAALSAARWPDSGLGGILI